MVHASRVVRFSSARRVASLRMHARTHARMHHEDLHDMQNDDRPKAVKGERQSKKWLTRVRAQSQM